jgi:hypothetical protein
MVDSHVRALVPLSFLVNLLMFPYFLATGILLVIVWFEEELVRSLDATKLLAFLEIGISFINPTTLSCSLSFDCQFYLLVEDQMLGISFVIQSRVV